MYITNLLLKVHNKVEVLQRMKQSTKCHENRITLISHYVSFWKLLLAY